MGEDPVRGTEQPSKANSETRHRKLRDIFVTVTGSEEFTERQEQHTSSRYLVAEEALSEPVTAIAKDDGLSDTFSDLEYEVE